MQKVSVSVPDELLAAAKLVEPSFSRAVQRGLRLLVADTAGGDSIPSDTADAVAAVLKAAMPEKAAGRALGLAIARDLSYDQLMELQFDATHQEINVHLERMALDGGATPPEHRSELWPVLELVGAALASPTPPGVAVFDIDDDYGRSTQRFVVSRAFAMGLAEALRHVRDTATRLLAAPTKGNT